MNDEKMSHTHRFTGLAARLSSWVGPGRMPTRDRVDSQVPRVPGTGGGVVDRRWTEGM